MKIGKVDRCPGAGVPLLLILLHIWLALPALTVFSPTYDEPVHLTAGAVYWKTGDYRFNGHHHPAFGEMWAAIPLNFMKNMIPVQHPAWIAQQWSPVEQYAFADVFLFRNFTNADRLIAAGRAMQLGMSCVLGLLVFWFALKLAGVRAAIFAGLFWALSPTFLANGTIVSTDLAFAVFFFGFFAALTQFGKFGYDVLAGVCLGLAFASKYFAVAIVPITAVLFVVQPALRKSARSWGIVAALGFGVLLVVYRVHQLDVFVEGIRNIFGRSQAGRSSFFLGQHGTQGWLMYFPFVFVVKTPVPLLISIICAIVAVFGGRIRYSHALWIPPVLFFLVACTSKVQIGHRHILAIYPFLFVMAGIALAQFGTIGNVAAGILLVGNAVGTFLVRPNYLPYFNELVGGGANGYKYVTDSNVDWGQGLKQLASELSESERQRGIYLSYFGVVDPHEYGIRYINVGSDRIVPRTDDAPTLVQKPTMFAISVTNLQATYYGNSTVFDWLRGFTPTKKIADSIFVYDFSEHPEAIARLEALRG